MKYRGFPRFNPKIFQKEVQLDLGENQIGLIKQPSQKRSFFYVDSGVEHAVTFVDDLVFDLEHIGKIVRHHAAFQPRGVNVDFAKLTSSGIDLRVYEKGVEAETLACGTGAIATALAAFYLYNIKPSILINFKHDLLKVDFENKKNNISKVKLITFPSWVYSGNFLLD